MTGGTWFTIRIGLCAFGFFVAMLIPVEQFDELRSISNWMPAILCVFAIISLILIPPMLLFVIGIQAINPFSDDKWTPPTHRSNPLRLGNPLLFFHFGAFFLGATGLGFLASSPWKGLMVAARGMFVVLGSIMMLVGIRLCMRAFKDKMTQTPSNQSDADERV